MPTALITGASRGLGAAISEALAERGWDVAVTARDSQALHRFVAASPSASRITAVAGDVGDQAHRRELVERAARAGGIDLVVNNASDLGAAPLPKLVDYPLDRLTAVLQTNVVAPLALIQDLLPHLRDGAAVVNVSSDAGVEAYEGWGGYGASKAALDHVSAVLGVEQPALRVYAFDPGDMRTQMHQDAYPGADISDRPEPHTVVPALLALIDTRPPSGRYTASALLATAGSAA
jgi:NAD(P)-dependent dehydrogenase (short-subunit alcohol dehydrogenase family)